MSDDALDGEYVTADDAMQPHGRVLLRAAASARSAQPAGRLAG